MRAYERMCIEQFIIRLNDPSRNRPGVRLPPRADCWSGVLEGRRLVHALSEEKQDVLEEVN